MTYLRNTFTGQSNGTVATAANSAVSGAGFSHINKAGGGEVHYIANGSDMTMRITNGTSETYARYTTDGSDGRRAIVRRDVTVSSLPTATSVLCRIARDDGTSTLIAHLSINSAGRFVLFVGGTALSTSSFTASVGGHYWVELAYTAASAAGVSDGVAEYRIYNDAGAIVASSSHGINTATVPHIARFGGVLSTSGWVYDTMSEVAALFTDELDAWIGAVPWLDKQLLHVAASAPGIATVGSGYNDLSPAATSFTWVQTAGSSMTMTDGRNLGVYIVGANVGTTLSWNVYATNAFGNSRTRTVSIDVAPATLLVCDGTSWKVADAAALAVIALLPNSNH